MPGELSAPTRLCPRAKPSPVWPLHHVPISLCFFFAPSPAKANHSRTYAPFARKSNHSRTYANTRGWGSLSQVAPSCNSFLFFCTVNYMRNYMIDRISARRHFQFCARQRPPRAIRRSYQLVQLEGGIPGGPHEGEPHLRRARGPGCDSRRCGGMKGAVRPEIQRELCTRGASKVEYPAIGRVKSQEQPISLI